MQCKSEYFSQLSLDSQRRYESKVLLAGLQCDPYSIDDALWTEEPEQIPDIDWSDVMLYMISSPSPYTREEIKAWKGMLDSQNFVKAGWLDQIRLHKYNTPAAESDMYLVMAKVKHSQRLSAPHLLPWVVVETNGEVKSCHCTCMAGLGEACSHIATVLTTLVIAKEQRSKLGLGSCTSESCKWLLPAGHKNVTPARIRAIRLKRPTSVSSDHQACTTSASSTSMAKRRKPAFSSPSPSRLGSFYEKINAAKFKPAILKITQPYAASFMEDTNLPRPISDLYDPDALSLSYPELLLASERALTSMKVNSQEICELELKTRGQSSNKLWYLHRAGRITASNFKAVTVTNPAMPSQSLIKRISYPQFFKFHTAATSWGCTHEKNGIEVYSKKMQGDHQSFEVTEAGLFLDEDRPYIGASPDSITNCICCGKGIVEVKCPYCYREGLPDEGNVSEAFCMYKDENGEWSLKKDHAYYFQIQMQLAVCKVNHCDFVVWTKEDFVILRIFGDKSFYESKLDVLQHFFVSGVLPEIIGKWFTRKPVCDSKGTVPLPALPSRESCSASSSSLSFDVEDFTKLWCYCNSPSFGEMILCDNERCTIQWFHFDCLRIRCPPKGKWYCPSCRKLPKYNKGNKTQKQ